MTDVCRECNGTRLSPLDAYFCALYDEYFAEPRDFKSTVVFRYSFDLLLRTLLKIAYNSARSAGSDVVPFHSLRGFILGLDERPKHVAAFLELVSPSLVPQEPSGELKKIMPLMYRSAVTKLLSPAGEQAVTRVVAVNSFYFHLVIQPESISPGVFEEAAEDLGALIAGVVRLSPERHEVVISSSPQDGVRSIAPHLRAHSPQYREYFERRRGKGRAD